MGIPGIEPKFIFIEKYRKKISLQNIVSVSLSFRSGVLIDSHLCLLLCLAFKQLFSLQIRREDNIFLCISKHFIG